MTMAWCQAHWTALRESIEGAGLGHLISQDGEAAAQRIKDEVEGGATDATFDPLIAAWAAIDRAFLEPLSVERRLSYYMHSSGDCCSLCELARINPAKPWIVSNWIGGVTREVRGYCIAKGLVKP